MFFRPCPSGPPHFLVFKTATYYEVEKIVFQLIFFSGKSFNRKAQSNIINPDFDFQKLGIGGLDEEFKEIFR